MIFKRLYLLLPFLMFLSACAPSTQTAIPFVVVLTTPPPNFPTGVSSLTVEVSVHASETATPEPPTSTSMAPSQTLPAASPTILRETYTPYYTITVPYETYTPTAGPTETYIPYIATPTETLLPPLTLPTELPKAQALVAWTGLPTYPADSDPGLLFRVDYDPLSWAQTSGNFGDIVLASRLYPYCIITPWVGRGLPVDWKTSHEFRIIGSASFDVNTVTSAGKLKFVSYVGGDHHVLTGFQVTFADQPEACLQAAEIVFGTLRSFAAIPTYTPSVSPTP